MPDAKSDKIEPNDAAKMIFPIDVAGIRKELEKILAKEKAAAFIKQLLAETARYAAPSNTLVEEGDVLRIYDMAQKQKGMVRSGDTAGGGRNVPRGTVPSIVVTPRKELRLSDLRLDPSKLEKEAAGDTPPHANYRDEAAGVTYEVFDRQGADYGRVLGITYGPAAGHKRLRCPGSD